MPTIVVSQETYNKLLQLKGDLDWDSFFDSMLFSDINKILRYLGRLLDEGEPRRIKRWR